MLCSMTAAQLRDFILETVSDRDAERMAKFLTAKWPPQHPGDLCVPVEDTAPLFEPRDGENQDMVHLLRQARDFSTDLLGMLPDCDDRQRAIQAVRRAIDHARNAVALEPGDEMEEDDIGTPLEHDGFLRATIDPPVECDGLRVTVEPTVGAKVKGGGMATAAEKIAEKVASYETNLREVAEKLRGGDFGAPPGRHYSESGRAFDAWANEREIYAGGMRTWTRAAWEAARSHFCGQGCAENSPNGEAKTDPKRDRMMLAMTIAMNAASTMHMYFSTMHDHVLSGIAAVAAWEEAPEPMPERVTAAVVEAAGTHGPRTKDLARAIVHLAHELCAENLKHLGGGDVREAFTVCFGVLALAELNERHPSPDLAKCAADMRALAEELLASADEDEGGEVA